MVTVHTLDLLGLCERVLTDLSPNTRNQVRRCLKVLLLVFALHVGHRHTWLLREYLLEMVNQDCADVPEEVSDCILPNRLITTTSQWSSQRQLPHDTLSTVIHGELDSDSAYGFHDTIGHWRHQRPTS